MLLQLFSFELGEHEYQLMQHLELLHQYFLLQYLCDGDGGGVLFHRVSELFHRIHCLHMPLIFFYVVMGGHEYLQH